MNKVDIGILLSAKIEFELKGDFCIGGDVYSGDFCVSACDGALFFAGKRYERLSFVPVNDDCRFLLRDVVIGVGFHWERKEDQLFKGELIFIPEGTGVRAINRLFIEDYLVSVISSEMSATSSLEFLKAHTVISRSWLYAQLLRKERVQNAVLGHETEGEVVRWYAREDHTLFDLCADDHCQRYQGLTRAVNSNVEVAVKATENIVLKHGSEVCDARFSKCCGGATERFSACWEDVDYDYLQAFSDTAQKEPLPPLDTEEGARAWIEGTPDAFCSAPAPEVLSQVLNNYDRETHDFYRWRVEYSQDELSRLVTARSGIDFGVVEDLQAVERGASGRLVRLRIVGSKCTKVVGKELEIRRWLSPSHLYSSAFVVDKLCDGATGEPRFVLKGAGWGHGVGLCQIGAAVMGARGYTYEQILQHYYPGAMLETI